MEVVVNSNTTMSAAQAVGKFLQSLDGLLKVGASRGELEQEASIDVRFKNGAKDQLDATREGIRGLFNARSHIQCVKNEAQVVGAL